MSDVRKPLVSIVCNAYNHEKYIGDALSGFVMQKTSFPYEILVHDDASADNTASVIRRYEKQYPELIKPIYQTENQYSKRARSVSELQFARARGKYIALCEGDDYWTDPLKLQKQADALENHPEVDICAHAALSVRADTKKKIGKVMPAAADCILPAESVIAGGGKYVATSSIMFRSTINDNIPDFRKYLWLDYTLQIQGALRGGMMYLGGCMSCYRKDAEASWSVRVCADKRLLAAHYEQICEMLKILDKDTGGQYHGVISKTIKQTRFKILEIKKEYKTLFQKEYRDVFSSLAPFHKLKILVKYSRCVLNKKHGGGGYDK